MGCNSIVVVLLDILSLCTVLYIVLVITERSNYSSHDDSESGTKLQFADHTSRSKDAFHPIHLLHSSIRDSISLTNHSAAGTNFASPSLNKKQSEGSQVVSDDSHASLLNGYVRTQNCSDKHCVSLLSKVQRERYFTCEQIAFRNTHVKPEDIPYNCVFRNGSGLDPVALISLPGSGNTWVRGLLEKATGLCTGCIYCDAKLRTSGLVGEWIRDGSVIAVKTHTPESYWKDAKIEQPSEDSAPYGSAIIISRNPYNALVAETNRMKSGGRSHTGKVNKTVFGKFLP